MIHPILQNSGRISLCIVLLGLLALALGGALAPLPGVGFGQGIGVGAVLAFVFGGVVLLLWDAMRYGSPGHRGSTNGSHKILFYSTLAILLIFLWFGISALCILLLWPAGWLVYLLPALPFLALTGILLYTIAVLIYSQRLADMEEEESAEEQPEVHPVQEPETEAIPLENIAIKSGRKIDVVPVSEIRYLKSEGDYVMIYTSSGHFLKEQTMKYFERHLPAAQFVRVHRSCIVNMRAILRIERYGKGEQLLLLQGGATIRVSEAGYRELKLRLKL